MGVCFHLSTSQSESSEFAIYQDSAYSIRGRSGIQSVHFILLSISCKYISPLDHVHKYIWDVSTRSAWNAVVTFGVNPLL